MDIGIVLPDHLQDFHSVGGIFLDGIQVVIQNDEFRLFGQIFQAFFACIENMDFIQGFACEITFSASVSIVSSSTMKIFFGISRSIGYIFCKNNEYRKIDIFYVSSMIARSTSPSNMLISE